MKEDSAAKDQNLKHQDLKEQDLKPSEADTRQRLCDGKPCKNEGAKAEQAESDLRHRGCPSGETQGKDGCFAVPVISDKKNQCQAGCVWNGKQCVAQMQQCQPGQMWTGSYCRTDCAAASSQAQTLIPELRRARQRRDEACRQDPSSVACTEAINYYNTILLEYGNLSGGLAAECRGALPGGNSI